MNDKTFCNCVYVIQMNISENGIWFCIMLYILICSQKLHCDSDVDDDKTVHNLNCVYVIQMNISENNIWILEGTRIERREGEGWSRKSAVLIIYINLKEQKEIKKEGKMGRNKGD